MKKEREKSVISKKCDFIVRSLIGFDFAIPSIETIAEDVDIIVALFFQVKGCWGHALPAIIFRR